MGACKSKLTGGRKPGPTRNVPNRDAQICKIMSQMMPRGLFCASTRHMRTGDFLNEESNFGLFPELSLCI